MIDEEAFKQARILILDDDDAQSGTVQEMLSKAEFDNVKIVPDPVNAVAELALVDPDLLVLSLDMQTADGIELLQRVRAAGPREVSLPVLTVTAATDPLTMRRALIEGAQDVLTKPIEETELLTRVRNLLEIRFLSVQIAGGERLEELVDRVARQRTQAQEEIQVELLNRFAKTAEFAETKRGGQHAEGVQFLSTMLARMLGFPEEQAQLIGKASLLHDVGKVAVPEEVWGKPGRLTPDEYEKVKVHASVGGDILGDGRSPLLWLAEEIARYHHERWDGTGYFGQAGEEIPMSARIVAVADAYDALTNDRPYRSALSSEEAIEEVKRESGHQFDPRVVDAFLGVQDA